MEADFSGYATKANLLCSDGRTILPGAFHAQDQQKVPLVWQHGHTDPTNVLGHVLLEKRDDGMYAYGFFNKTPKAQHTQAALEHKDFNALSIWANQLIEKAGRVSHGVIREVSLVLAGANPGAIIENITVRHSDGDEVLDDEAIIYTGLELEHADVAAHAEDDPEDLSIAAVYESMTEEQQRVLHYMVGQALEAGSEEEAVAAQSATTDTIVQTAEEGTEPMTRNVFEKDKEAPTGLVLSHADIKGIFADATRSGSLKEAVEAYALAHGIDNIDLLFPEARNLTTTPEWISRRMEWVSTVLNDARKSPFSRIRTMSADLTYEEARARGYITGNRKKEEWFGVAKRVTTPQTIYKKQKLDRDDVVDITDFDVVAWIKGEMRIMLDEEIARAILIGDGRAVDDEDKIQETNVRPIAFDDELYTIPMWVANDQTPQEIIDEILMSRQFYRGTAAPTLFTTETWITRFLLIRDEIGRRLYSDIGQLASEMRVARIVAVEAMESQPDIVGVLVNMADYNIGADRGGQVTMFDDFDIDWNQYKYLIETRMSGALTKVRSAICIRLLTGANEGDAPVAVVPPGWNGVDTVTIVANPGLVYRNVGTNAVIPPGTVTVPVGTTLTVRVEAADGFFLRPAHKTTWNFTNRAPRLSELVGEHTHPAPDRATKVKSDPEPKAES